MCRSPPDMPLRPPTHSALVCGRVVVVLAVLLVLSAVGANAASGGAGRSRDQVTRSTIARSASLTRELRRQRAETWHWQDVMGVPRTPPVARVLAGAGGSRRLLRVWRLRASRAKALALAPLHKSAWRCIHRYEGDWRAASGNGDYGGLQMNVDFQRTYGRSLL